MLTPRTITYGLAGAGAAGASLFRPYWGLLCLAVLYFFRPDVWGADAYLKPVLWITITVLAGWMFSKHSEAVWAGSGWIVMFLCLYGVATVFAPHRDARTLARLILHVKIFVAAFLIIKLCNTPLRLAGFVAAMLAGVLWFVKVAIGSWSSYGYSGDKRVDVAVGQGGDSNYMAWILAAMVPFVLYKVIRGHAWQRVVAIILTPLFLASIVATGSRGGLLCLLASCGMFLLLLRQLKLILVLVLMGVFFVQIASPEYKERIGTITLDPAKMDASLLSRYQNVIAGLKIVRDYPVFGTGLDTFPEVKKRYLTEEYKGREEHVAHNTYIQMAAEVGLPLLSVFCLFNLWLVWRLWPATKKGFGKADIDYLEWVRIGTLSALAATWVEMVKGDEAHKDFLWWLYAIGYGVYRVRKSASLGRVKKVSRAKTDAGKTPRPKPVPAGAGKMPAVISRRQR